MRNRRDDSNAGLGGIVGTNQDDSVELDFFTVMGAKQLSWTKWGELVFVNDCILIFYDTVAGTIRKVHLGKGKNVGDCGKYCVAYCIAVYI